MRVNCPICSQLAPLLDVGDFNKSYEELRGRHLPMAGVPIYYRRCEQCGFCFAPEIYDWTLDEFAARIYNEGHAEIDPDYVDARPRANAQNLLKMLHDVPSTIRHLDYGAGNGLLSDLLFQTGWDSVSYDPFTNRDARFADLGKFDLITAFEVFEHVPDVKKLAEDIASLLNDNGIVLFSTLLSDGNIYANQRLTWWYASPRNGHISLFSRQSLVALGEKYGFNLSSFSEGFHAFWRDVPAWAQHLIRAS
jgi:SAM-dependent methyltransferase